MFFLQILIEILQGIQFIDTVFLAVACPEVDHCHIVVIENSTCNGISVQCICDEVQIFAIFFCLFCNCVQVGQEGFDAVFQFRQVFCKNAKGFFCFIGEVVDACCIVCQEIVAEVFLCGQFFHAVVQCQFLFHGRSFQIFSLYDQHFYDGCHQLFYRDGGIRIVQCIHIFVGCVVILNFCKNFTVYFHIRSGDQVDIFCFYPCIGDGVSQTSFFQTEFSLDFLLRLFGCFFLAAAGGEKHHHCQKQGEFLFHRENLLLVLFFHSVSIIAKNFFLRNRKRRILEEKRRKICF